MDVICFLCVSLGSSTAQIHVNIGNRRACACSEADCRGQNMWEGKTTEEQHFFVRFMCGEKNAMQRIFIKKCILFTVGSVCRVKRFTTAWQTFLWWRWGWNGGAEVAETAVKTLLSCVFRPICKAMVQVYQCRWRIYREIIFFFQFRISHVLHFISMCDLFTDSARSLRRITTIVTELVMKFFAFFFL
jgi:hypothetical protein